MSAAVALEFEKPVKNLEAKIAELSRLVGEETDGAMSVELEKLREQAAKRLTQVYSNLDPWQKCQVARHPDRPQFLALADMLLSDYQPLAGDRNFGDDQAILGGLARFRGRAVVVMGHEKGHDMNSRVKHNFGMGRPEGYRKAIRLRKPKCPEGASSTGGIHINPASGRFSSRVNWTSASTSLGRTPAF